MFDIVKDSFGHIRCRPVPGGGGGEGVGRPPYPPPTSNYRVPPAHRFHKYKLRLLHFRMQTLIKKNQIKFIKRNSGGACPQTLLGRHCADGARAPPPPPPINDPPLGQPWVRACVVLFLLVVWLFVSCHHFTFQQHV